MSDAVPPGFSEAEIEALRRVAKEELRKRLAPLRRTLSSESRRERSLAMCHLLYEHEAFQRAQVVAGYHALKFEIDPRVALERVWALSKRVVLPRVNPQTRELSLHFVDADTPLEPSAFAVEEPAADVPQVELSEVDVVLVPGLAFDARGHRLGYGQGFYDRLLPRLPDAVRIGLCFELSLLAEVPAAPYDIPVDWLITDRRVLRCER